MNATDLAAAEAEAGPSRREALAAQAQQQVVALVQACQALLRAYGAASAASAASAPAVADDGGDGGAAGAAAAAGATEDLARLHEVYLERRAALRESLERCRAFREEDEEEGEEEEGDEASIEALAARRRALVAELETKNQTIKGTIDRLREMLDALQLFRAEASA
jgi:hypothetical protein